MRSPSASPPPAVTEAPPAPPTSPGLHLPRDLAIDRYELDLAIDPRQAAMTGTARIHGRIVTPTALLWLHAESLTIERAVAVRASGEETALDVVGEVTRGQLALRAAQPLGLGPTTVVIEYRAPLSETETAGTFRQRVGDDWYVFTQHEAISARRSFPCLDEPDRKVPWRVRLSVPKDHLAVGNAPVESDVLDGDRRVVTLVPTEPLPSYLVAYAVGPFDIVDAGKSAHGAPLRIITPRGRAADAAFAAEVTPRILAETEAWFGVPYAFGKLDSIAIPTTQGFGAMENPGLITYREDLLLMPRDASEARRAAYVAVAAHEIAHQWFGNLVTLAWWDDLWLNEAFASWLPEKIVAALYPAWVKAEDTVARTDGSLRADSLATARRVRQPIADEGEIGNAFDGITYGKGSAVLRMMEAWIGRDRFRDGVRAYITAHARGNATTADFIAAVATQAKDKDVATAFRGFLDQAGAPRIRTSWTCAAGGGARVTLTQDRFLPIGAASSTPTSWTMPVCFVAGGRDKLERSCVVLAAPTTTVELASCPRWLWPNAGAMGYYRVALDPAGWRDLRALGWEHLSSAERQAVGQDLAAGVGSGDVSIDVALDSVPALLSSRQATLITVGLDQIRAVADWVPAAQRPAFGAWVRTHVEPIARTLGVTPKAGDDLDRLRLRRDVIGLLGDVGGDSRFGKQVVAMARAWRKLPEAGRDRILVAAVQLEPALHDTLLADWRVETDRTRKRDLTVALGAVGDAARLEAALGLMLDPAYNLIETAPILTAALAREETRAVTEAFVVSHFDELLARVPEPYAVALVGALATSCDAARVAPMRELAQRKLGDKRGAERRIAQAFERMSQCAAQRASIEPALRAWLARLPASNRPTRRPG